MLVLLEEMFYGLNLVEELNIHPATLKRFLVIINYMSLTWLAHERTTDKWLVWFQLRVQENYRNNPFHNFRHCFCVTQMMYVLIHQCKLQKHLSKRDICVLLTACICHDLDHPGFNNTYGPCLKNRRLHFERRNMLLVGMSKSCQLQISNQREDWNCCPLQRHVSAWKSSLCDVIQNPVTARVQHFC